MSTDKRATTMRLSDEVREKLRYLAYMEHRSVNGEIEKAIADYILAWESKHGPIPDLPMPKAPE